ncbi:hypothetical protein OH77DRAFT_1287921 [Trametes cingulata]|nr:hypothetical protein OH77DRAFT_1287921 [Trametes cingulata]
MLFPPRRVQSRDSAQPCASTPVAVREGRKLRVREAAKVAAWEDSTGTMVDIELHTSPDRTTRGGRRRRLPSINAGSSEWHETPSRQPPLSRLGCPFQPTTSPLDCSCGRAHITVSDSSTHPLPTEVDGIAGILPIHSAMLLSKRYSTSSSTTAASYPYRQSFLEVRNGQEYVSMLPPMTTEEDLLQEGLLDDSAAYDENGDVLPQRRHKKILRALVTTTTPQTLAAPEALGSLIRTTPA